MQVSLSRFSVYLYSLLNFKTVKLDIISCTHSQQTNKCQQTQDKGKKYKYIIYIYIHAMPQIHVDDLAKLKFTVTCKMTILTLQRKK